MIKEGVDFSFLGVNNFDVVNLDEIPLVVVFKNTKSNVTDFKLGEVVFNFTIKYFDFAITKFPVLFIRFMQ